MSKNNKEDEKEEFYRFKLKASEQPKEKPDTDEEIYKFRYRSPPQSSPFNIPTFDERKYKISVHATPRPARIASNDYTLEKMQNLEKAENADYSEIEEQTSEEEVELTQKLTGIENGEFKNPNDDRSTNENKVFMTEDRDIRLVQETLNISIPNFRERVENHFGVILGSIECTVNQKENIRIKSANILTDFISKAADNEFNISSTADPNVIATSIIFTAIVSNENMPELNMKQIAKLGDIKSSKITYYYNTYFRELYPRIKFDPTVYKLKPIKLIFSFYFFQLLMDVNVIFSNQIQLLKEKILYNTDLPVQLDTDNVRELQEIATNYPDVFTNYFSDIFNIVKHLMELVTLYRIIGASIKISPIAKMLHEMGINLTQGLDGFRRSLTEIYDFLKENNPDVFPKRVIQTDTPKEERPERRRQIKRIVGTKIKLYVIKHIYNGKYLRKGQKGCPECLKEGLSTDITRIKGLEFHHPTEKKELQYTAENLYQLFIKDQLNPHFLDDLIRIMKREQVELLCTNHHSLLHHEDYQNFRYLINWAKLFSYPAEIIRLLVRVAVDNFHKTRDLTVVKKKEKRRYIRSKIKKKYIIEVFYGGYCPTCGKFNTQNHLTSYHFAHANQHIDDFDIYDLYRSKPCSKIVEVLVREEGGYVCGNCHMVIHFDKYIPFLEEIFEEEKVIQKIMEDYDDVCKNYRLMCNNALIGDPLKTSKFQYGKLKDYLMAIYEISNSGREVTHSALSAYMGLATTSIYSFFKRNTMLVNKYINIEVGKSGWNGEETKYSLNEEGEKLIILIKHFRDYFSSIE